MEVKPRYLIYHRLTNTVEEGDISLVKDEILKYVLVKIETKIEDTIADLEQLLRDINMLRNMNMSAVTSSDIDTLIKHSETLKYVSDLVAGYITLSRLNSYEELLQSVSEYLAVEEVSGLLNDEIEMLENHEEYEKAELLRKCKRDTVRWVGFDRHDEYGSIVCEVSE